MGKPAERNWSSDKLRKEVVGKAINGATDEQNQQCLDELESCEHGLFKKQQYPNKYKKFSELMPGFQNALHKRFGVETGDQVLLDFMKILSEQCGGYRTTIPAGGDQFWFFLAKSGIELHESVK